jgi:hypothetical protein
MIAPVLTGWWLGSLVMLVADHSPAARHLALVSAAVAGVFLVLLAITRSLLP